MGLRPETRARYLKIVQAHFYGADKWRIAEELDISPDTIARALKWYRDGLDSMDQVGYILLVIQETRNHIQHLWSYIRKLQDGLPELYVESGEIKAEKRKHYPTAVTNAHKRIIELRQFLIFLRGQLELAKIAEGGEEVEEIIYDMSIIEPTDEEMEEWELKLLPEPESVRKK